MSIPSLGGIALSGGGLVAVDSTNVYNAITAQFYGDTLASQGATITLNAETNDGYARLLAPSAAALDDGGFVVTWTRMFGSGYDAMSYIVGQAFDASGTATGKVFQIGSAGNGEGLSHIAVLSDGSMVASWTSNGQVLYQLLTATGTKVGDAHTLDTSTNAGNPVDVQLVALDNGGFALMWDELIPSGGYVTIGALHVQMFGADGVATSGDIVVDSTGPTYTHSADIAVLASGAIAWAKRPADGAYAENDIAVRIYAPDGSEVGSEQLVNTNQTGDHSQPSIEALAGGGFIVAWTDVQPHAYPLITQVDVHAQLFASGEVLTGTDAADTLTGGAGTDTASYADAAAGVHVSLLVQAAQNTPAAGWDTLTGIENLTGSAHNDVLIGDAGANRLEGGDGNDHLNGGRGADYLIGGAGDDTLTGGLGIDAMAGGTGNDYYYVDSTRDVVREFAGEGTDTVITTRSLTLAANVERLTLAAGAGSIKGTGNELANVLIGNEGDNVLDGKAGADRLTGGDGVDTFVFSTAPAGSTDLITDFTSGTDHIALSAKVFTAIAATGVLNDADLAIGTKATTADQHLIYNPVSGALFYDADGSGAQAAVKIAVLANHADLHAADIVVI